MTNGSRGRAWLAIAATIVTAAMAFAPSALARPAGTSAWRVKNATDNGAYTAPRMSVTLVLAERNATALNALVASPHAALTPAQFAARFAPTTASVDAVRSWAAAKGLRVSSVSANRLLVTVSGSSSQISQALQTNLRRYHTAANGSFFAAATAARLPSALAASGPCTTHRPTRPAPGSGCRSSRKAMSAGPRPISRRSSRPTASRR